PQRQVPAFLDRSHIAASETAGPGGAPAAKRGRTTWRCGKRRPQSATRKAADHRAKPGCQSTALYAKTHMKTRDAAGLTNIRASIWPRQYLQFSHRGDSVLVRDPAGYYDGHAYQFAAPHNHVPGRRTTFGIL